MARPVSKIFDKCILLDTRGGPSLDEFDRRQNDLSIAATIINSIYSENTGKEMMKGDGLGLMEREVTVVANK